MKCAVIKRFRDKNSSKSFRVGDVYEADKERCIYLQHLGFLGKRVNKETNKKEEAYSSDVSDIDKMSYAELQELARNYGIKSVGVKKADLLQQVREVMGENR